MVSIILTDVFIVFFAVTMLLQCVGCFVPVCCLIIIFMTDGDLQPVAWVYVLLWCLSQSAIAKDGAYLHQLQWSFACLQKNLNFLGSTYQQFVPVDMQLKTKSRLPLGQQPLLFPKVGHEELTFMYQSWTSPLERSGFSITQSKGAALPAQLDHTNTAQAQNRTQIPGLVKALCGKHTAGFRSYRTRDIN